LSTWDGIHPFAAMSERIFLRPATTLAPPLSRIFRSAAGLPTSVLVGATASVSSEAAKRARWAARRSHPDCSANWVTDFVQAR
jgi:hypothetical protein